MNQKKAKQSIKARAIIKITHDREMKGNITYKDRYSYELKTFEDITGVLARGELSGLIKDKRVQPNSITITFNLI
jgi:hypothetical protein